MNWQPIKTAPLDGSEILIVANGMVIQARFSPGEWSEHFEGREYDGPVWCAFDDALTFEIEEIPFEHDAFRDGYDHGQVTHWAPLPELPEKLNETQLGVL